MNLRAFIYHDTADQELAEELRRYFKPLEKAKPLSLSLSAASDVAAGADILKRVKEEIQLADIILLIVTANLLASDFVYEDLADWVFRRRQAGKCVVVPVIFSKCRWDLTIYGALEALPNKGAAIKSAYPSKDEGLHDVSEGVETILKNFDQTLKGQALEVDHLKTALAAFNFYDQLPPAAAPASASLFSVLVLKGGEKSGHSLLAWRWRTEVARLPADVRPITVRLTENEAVPAEISREIHRALHAGAHDDARAYTPADIAAPIFTRLQTDPLLIRLDDFNPFLQQDTVEDFLRELQTALDRLLQKNAGQQPPHRLWIFLLHRSWSNAADFTLNCSAKIELPPIGPVDALALSRWQEENDAQLPAIAKHRIACEQDVILLQPPENNQVLDVLDRLCDAVFAKTQLYDEYLLKLE